jgi:hypothetical protein
MSAPSGSTVQTQNLAASHPLRVQHKVPFAPERAYQAADLLQAVTLLPVLLQMKAPPHVHLLTEGAPAVSLLDQIRMQRQKDFVRWVSFVLKGIMALS